MRSISSLLSLCQDLLRHPTTKMGGLSRTCHWEEEELNEFMDDDQDEEVEEWLMAPVMPSRATVIDDLCVRTSNLEYRHGELVKKMETVSDAEVADSIAIREIHPRVTTLEGQ
nr:hypothetical protein [Tanacetum cinerariifolium]